MLLTCPQTSKTSPVVAASLRSEFHCRVNPFLRAELFLTGFPWARSEFPIFAHVPIPREGSWPCVRAAGHSLIPSSPCDRQGFMEKEGRNQGRGEHRTSIQGAARHGHCCQCLRLGDHPAETDGGMRKSSQINLSVPGKQRGCLSPEVLDRFLFPLCFIYFFFLHCFSYHLSLPDAQHVLMGVDQGREDPPNQTHIARHCLGCLTGSSAKPPRSCDLPALL